MERRHRVVAGALAIATVVAGGSVAWAASPAGSSSAPRSTSDVGIAGPLGPQAITAFPSYFKRVTFADNQLGQAQEIAAHLPVGRYLVRVVAPDGSSPDCMGVSFPLVPPSATAGGGTAFTGYVSVAKQGDATTVSCYLPAAAAGDPDPDPTYELFYVPALSVSG